MPIAEPRWAWALAGLAPYAAPGVRAKRAAAWGVCLSGALAVCLVQQQELLLNGGDPEYQQFHIRYDPDIHLIWDGLGAAPHVGDTLSWWTGPWVMPVPYWRPVASLLFWVEWKAFGADFRGWSVVTIALAVFLACGLLWALDPLLGPQGAAAVVWASYVALFTLWPRIAPLHEVLRQWKNQPDLLAGIGIAVAMGLAARSRPLAALVPAALSAATKELGFAAFLIVPGVLLWRRRQGHDVKSLKRVTAISAMLLVALLVWRWRCVGVGYQMGTNTFWWRRALMYCGGLPLTSALTGYWQLVVPAGLLTVALWLGNRRPAWATALLGVGLPLTAAVYDRQLGQGLLVSTTTMLVDSWVFVQSLAWFLAAWAALRFSRPEVVLGLGIMLIGSAPTFLATQTLEHTRWLGGVGHGILAWAAINGLWAAAPRIWQTAKRELARLRGEEYEAGRDELSPSPADDA